MLFIKKNQLLPTSIEEAINTIKDRLGNADKSYLLSMSQKDLIMLHSTWGRRIRNELGLWDGDQNGLKINNMPNPDDVSMYIIKNVWKRLREEREESNAVQKQILSGK